MSKPQKSLQGPIPLRLRLGWSQDKFAESLGYSRNYISMIERGEKKPGPRFLRDLEDLEKRLTTSERKPNPAQRDDEVSVDQTHSGDSAGPRGRLRAMLRKAGLTPAQLAKRIGRPIGFVQSLVDGGARISHDTAELIAEAVPDLTVEQLTGGSDEPPVIDETGLTGTVGARPALQATGKGKARYVPLLSMVQAGQYQIGHTDEGYTGGGVWTDLEDRSAFGVTIDGNSMAPRFNPGDCVVCSPKSSLNIGDTVVVRTIEGAAFCKIYLRESGGSIFLGSVNSQHPTMEIPRDEVAWIYPVRGAVLKNL